jgi:hypothetical protein
MQLFTPSIFERREIMKVKTKVAPCAIAACIIGAVLGPDVHAQEILGSIGFAAVGNAISGGSFADPTSFAPFQPFVTSGTGAYSGVTFLTPVTFTGFQLNPQIERVAPLWSFAMGSTEYSFDATSVTASFDFVSQEWDLSGNGVAMVTGFTSTPGSWNINLSESGSTIVFDSSAATVDTPEGSSLALMFSGIVGMAAFVRKQNR